MFQKNLVREAEYRADGSREESDGRLSEATGEKLVCRPPTALTSRELSVGNIIMKKRDCIYLFIRRIYITKVENMRLTTGVKYRRKKGKLLSSLYHKERVDSEK